jgi:hypothetical protein
MKPAGESWLKAILVMAIFAMAGPEIIPALEMTTLLELLGAALFLSAFDAAFRLLAQDLARALVDVALPPELRLVFRHSSRPLEKGNLAGYLLLRVTYCLVMGLVVAMFFGTHVV